ncbi:hypothetical protein CcCBS67573_g06374 [Chytriomyces confervae]|uniref:Uncharacterized protein n=1 Tax=Chytriomyces confervae TaxID=246404 RepID=A0A507F5R7_9FUNG|nr:hypothetical protein CcCBS67573_g06374 [Chytriomyces confervae]
MAAQCTVLGSNNLFSVSALSSSDCITGPVYTGSVPSATCVTTATSYNPLTTGATQQMDYCPNNHIFNLHTYNVNNYVQTIAFLSTTSVAGNPASTKSGTATLSSQNAPFMLTYSNRFSCNQQTIASWTTSGSKCQMFSTAVSTSHLTLTGTTVTTVANGAVVTNVVMVGSGHKCWRRTCQNSNGLTSKSYIPVDLQFPTSASLLFTMADIDLTISCTVIAETLTVKGEWDDNDHLDLAPNNHLDRTYGSLIVGLSITNSQVTVDQEVQEHFVGPRTTFPSHTSSCGFSFSVAAPNLGLSVNDGGDALGANEEFIFCVYTGPSSSPPQQTFALISLVADYSTDGGVTFPVSGQVLIPVDNRHCFGTSIAGSAGVLVGQVKDISNVMVFATTSMDTVNYFTLLA